MNNPLTSDIVKNDIKKIIIDNGNEMEKLDNLHKVYNIHFSKLTLQPIPKYFLFILKYSLLKDDYRQMTHYNNIVL